MEPEETVESERSTVRTRSSPTLLPNHISAVALDLRRFKERTNGLAHLSKREPRIKRQENDRSCSPALEVHLLEQQVARLIRVESARRRYLPGTTKDAIDWAILLDLTRAHLLGETVYSNVLRATLAIKEPELWSGLARLENEGLVDGMFVASESCHIAVWLSEFGAERMTRVLASA